MTTKPICTAKKTAYQPTNKEYKCPTCKAGLEFFYVIEAVCECPALHDDDVLACMSIHCTAHETQYISGDNFAAGIVAKKGIEMVCCPTCKGKGFVKKTKK